jgi:hypothetical protein
MKAYLEIELFGEDARQLYRLWENIGNMLLPSLGTVVFGGKPPSGWVAEITGFDSQYKYARSFLKRKLNYSRANSKGSRGIYAEYILESGKLYDVKEQTSWKKTHRYFCTVSQEGDIIILPESKVMECLKNHLESMSLPRPDNE